MPMDAPYLILKLMNLAARMKIGETDKNADCFDTDDCEMHNVGHYNSARLITIGTRFAEVFNNLKK